MHEPSHYLIHWCRSTCFQDCLQTVWFLPIGWYRFNRKGVWGSPHQHFAVPPMENPRCFGWDHLRHRPEFVRAGHPLGRGELIHLHSYWSWGVYDECPACVKVLPMDSWAPVSVRGTDPVALIRWEKFYWPFQRGSVSEAHIHRPNWERTDSFLSISTVCSAFGRSDGSCFKHLWVNSHNRSVKVGSLGRAGRSPPTILSITVGVV